ncbi:MAG: bL28 family ribosomal protein [Nitrospira sp.]
MPQEAGFHFGNNVSHANNKTRRVFNPNIQTVRAVVGKKPQAYPRLHALPAFRIGQESRLVLSSGFASP